MLIERNLENECLVVIAVEKVGGPSATVAVSSLADTLSLASSQTDSDVSSLNTDCLYFVCGASRNICAHPRTFSDFSA